MRGRRKEGGGGGVGEERHILRGSRLLMLRLFLQSPSESDQRFKTVRVEGGGEPYVFSE